ncbi:unnamed protein product [Rhizophagus irregularis]|nr:unnamed protein product [Rhizophagus irregularis]
METNDDDDPQENYQFLVRKMLPVFQKNIKSTISVPEVTNKLFSDDDEGDNNDDGGDDNDGDNVSEEKNEQNSDDDTLGYSSDDSELNFDAPELELEDDLNFSAMFS